METEKQCASGQDKNPAGETTSQAQADFEQGKQLLAAGDPILAAAAFHNALIGFEQEENQNGVANAVDKLGDICVERGDHAMALEHYERALDICAAQQDTFSVISLMKKMAPARRVLHQTREAASLYLDMLDIYSGFNNPAGAVTILEELAETYLEMGDRENAADTYRTVASIHANFKHRRQAEEYLGKAKSLLENRG